MADLNRPNYGSAWATTGEKVAPDAGKFALGWVQEMMPYQYENYLQARQDEAILYLLQKGIPEYSPTQEYTANKSLVLYNGVVYLATQTVTNVLPTVTASWKRVSTISDNNGVVSVAGGGTGATTQAQARTNLGLGTAATLDATNVVQKDTNGDFTANVITASLAGNASTADKWKTTRTIQLSGAATSSSANIDGSSNIVVSVTTLDASALTGTVPSTSLVNAVVKTSATGAAKLPKGTTAQRPADPEFGDFRANETTGLVEYWNGLSWVNPSAYTAEYVLNRANHTGFQAISTVTGLNTALNAKLSLDGGTLSGNLNVPSLNGGQTAGMRNKIINGKMEISQRGTSFPAIANGAYSLGRWMWGFVSTGAVTITQQGDAPSDNEFQFSLRAAVTAADTSSSAGKIARIIQRIEGFQIRDLIGRTFTISFRVRSSKTGVHCVALGNSGADRSYVAEYTINSANTWETKTITVTGGLPTAGTWNYLTGIGLEVNWTLACGTTFHTTAGTWQAGAFRATANQVNCLDTVGNIFAITGVQLEVGEVATPFEHRPYGVELSLCQRYYQVALVQVLAISAQALPWWFRTSMRAAPTIKGGGDGFTVYTLSTEGCYPVQTTGNVQTLSADAEL